MVVLSPQNSSLQRRGTALVMAVILSVVLTGLVLAIAWNAGVAAQIAGGSIHMDQATIAAESAGQWAVWQFKNNNQWRQSLLPQSLPTLTMGDLSFNYAVTCTDAGATATLYWPFDEGNGSVTADTSGHGNTGQLIGGVTWTTGKYGSALLFDGSTGYVDAGNNSSTNIVGSVTMSAWVKLNSAGQDQKVGGNQDGVAGGYKMAIYGLKAEFEVRDASNTAWLNRNVAGGTVMTMGSWYHVAGVYDVSAHTIKSYVNGLPDREIDNLPGDALATTTGHFIMGREPWTGAIGTTRYFNGAIDDVRVYNRVLSAQEIKTLANSSVHVHAVATLCTSAANAPTSSVDFIACAPNPLPPVAPALTVGGNLQLAADTINGDVQATGSITGTGPSSVTGQVSYGTTYSDSHSYITITTNGKAGTPTHNATATVPTINYSSIQSQAPFTGSSGTGKTYQFTPLYNGQVPIIYVNGNVTDPIIDTSQSGGTLLINGTLTLTKSATFGTPGYPAYIIVEKSVSHTGGTINVTGALYVGQSWTHGDCSINGDVCVAGNVTDNSTSGTTIVVGGIPWFDPRSTAPAVKQPLFYTTYKGIAP